MILRFSVCLSPRRCKVTPTSHCNLPHTHVFHVHLPSSLDTHYMASASRDRMVHVFSSRASRSGYEPIQSVPDHSASVTAISFTTNKEQELQLLSCGADKSVLYHVLDKVPGSLISQPSQLALLLHILV